MALRCSCDVLMRDQIDFLVGTIQLHAAAALLAVGDSSALPIAEAELLRPDPSLLSEALPNLRGELSRGIMAEAAIPVLAGFSSNAIRRRSVPRRWRYDIRVCRRP
jgi:hypothetical protein